MEKRSRVANAIPISLQRFRFILNRDSVRGRVESFLGGGGEWVLIIGWHGMLPFCESF